MSFARPRRAVLAGAGHAHLHIIDRASDFADRGYELVVISPGPFWYSGLATGMLGGIYSPDLDRVDVERLAKRRGATFLRDEIVGLDALGKRLTLRSGGDVPFDAASLNLGSEPPPIEGAAGERCFTVKPIEELWRLRRMLEAEFKRAGTIPSVVIAGGGPTACELAGNIAGLASRSGARAEVTIVTGQTVLKQLPRRAGNRVVRSLEQRGVTIRKGLRVARIEGAEAVLADGSRLPFDFFVNASGLRANPLLARLGLPLSEDGAVRVDANLRSIGNAAIHAGGDCAAFEGHSLPRIGVYAIRQAPILHANLLAALEGSNRRKFKPQHHFLWIMNLGDGTGLASRGALWWHGRAAFWLKDRIDRRFLARYHQAASGT